MSLESRPWWNASHSGETLQRIAKQRLCNEETQLDSNQTSSGPDRWLDEYESLKELVSRLPWNAVDPADVDFQIDIDEIFRLSNPVPRPQ